MQVAKLHDRCPTAAMTTTRCGGGRHCLRLGTSLLQVFETSILLREKVTQSGSNTATRHQFDLPITVFNILEFFFLRKPQHICRNRDNFENLDHFY